MNANSGLASPEISGGKKFFGWQKCLILGE